MTDGLGAKDGLLATRLELDHSYSMYDHVVKKVRRIALGNIVVPEMEKKGIHHRDPEAIAEGKEILDMLGLGAAMDFDLVTYLAIPKQELHTE